MHLQIYVSLDLDYLVVVPGTPVIQPVLPPLLLPQILVLLIPDHLSAVLETLTNHSAPQLRLDAQLHNAPPHRHETLVMLIQDHAHVVQGTQHHLSV